MLALTFILALGLTPLVSGHAIITSPAVRVPGPKHLEVCGKTSYDRLILDPSGHIEEQLPIASDACELALCRGMLFEDQPASSIQRVAPGQGMNLAVDCTIPHGGPANVTLLDTTGGGSGRIIGNFLRTFDDFCPTSGGTPADQSNLQFILPGEDDIADACQQDGDCVVQLFWATPDLSQNYYYCVDVTVDLSLESPSSTSLIATRTSTGAAGATSTLPPDAAGRSVGSLLLLVAASVVVLSQFAI